MWTRDSPGREEVVGMGGDGEQTLDGEQVTSGSVFTAREESEKCGCLKD
jgi:hypothetical protein